MTTDANPYRFGDLLALARQSWVHRMAAELENRGFGDYRLTVVGPVGFEPTLAGT